MKNNKGITLVSLVVYIAVVFVITAAMIRITTYFTNNMADVADVSFETEFQKINLYLLDESKKTGNNIAEINTEGTQITFSNGNKYVYNAEDKKMYLNETVKVCENVESCLFEQKTAENGKSVIVLKIKISGITKTVEYVMTGEEQATGKVNIQDYLWGESLVSYYLKAGDYVDYIPDTGTYKVADGQYGSGYTTEQGYQSFTTETGENSLKWRILSIDEQTGKIELVSETVGQTLYLQGADGYNHGVDILNDLCENLYSKTVNGTKVAIGRSINIEDINSKTTFDYKTYTNSSGELTYGDTKQLSTYGTGYMQYPNLYSEEIGYGTANSFNTTGLNKSDGLNDGVIDASGVTAYSTVIGSSDGNTLGTEPGITYTYYIYAVENYLNTNLGINTVQKGLLNIKSQYWLASRCVGANSSYAGFGVNYINSSGAVNSSGLFRSQGTSGDHVCEVRPVVTLNAAELVDFSVGDGSEENPWGMK